MLELKVSFKSSPYAMTIGELAKETGVAASTIRYWEQIGVLPRPLRVNRRRRYPPEAVYQLAVLRLAQACGFRLPEMRRLLHGFTPDARPSRRWQELGRKKMTELDEQLARLLAMRQLIDRVLQCQCVDLAECGRRIVANADLRSIFAGAKNRAMPS